MKNQISNHLRKLNDDELHASSIVAAKNERAALHVMLEHLAEVHFRRAFSPKYSDIKDYSIRKLGYDDKSAWKRVNAMFALIELPEIAPKIESGALSLTGLAVIERHFRIEKESAPLSRDKKLEVVRSMEGKSVREMERALIEQSSAPEKMEHREIVKPLRGTANLVSLVLSDADLEALEEIKDLLAHSHPGADRSKIVSHALCRARDLIRKERSKALLRSEKIRPEASEYTRPDAGLKNKILGTLPSVEQSSASPSEARTKRRFINEDWRYIWQKSEGKCGLCGSMRALQQDHFIPFAKRGLSTRENGRLLCRNCNQRAAIKMFGLEKMDPYINPPRSSAKE